MKISYDREEDILTVEMNPDARIDHAEQSGPFIAHFTESDRLVLLEILNASEFFVLALQASLRNQTVELPAAAH
jgi:hypothetical protein